MAAQVQPLPPQTINHFLFSPLRFCGRQWSQIQAGNQPHWVQATLKVLVACATAFAALPALAGALLYSAQHLQDVTVNRPNGSLSMLYQHKTDQTVAQEIKECLDHEGCEATVEVESTLRVERNNYYPDNVSRRVRLTKPASRLERMSVLFKHHFRNEKPLTLEGLYPCIWGGSSREEVARLNTVLAVHRGVSFYIAFDLAYVRTELLL